MSSVPFGNAPGARLRRWLDAAATVVFLAVCATYLWDRFGPEWPTVEAEPVAGTLDLGNVGPPPNRGPIPAEPLIFVENLELRLGAPTAPIGMEVWSDFECPYCKRFADTALPTIQRDYVDTGLLALAFRHAPLEGIHPSAVGAAIGSECAAEQGRFWEMHDALFEDPRQLDPRSLRQRAVRLGLDETAFDQCLAAGRAAERVRADVLAGRARSVSGTPSFLLGTLEPDGRLNVTRRFSGALPAARFTAAFDELLASVPPPEQVVAPKGR